MVDYVVYPGNGKYDAAGITNYASPIKKDPLQFLIGTNDLGRPGIVDYGNSMEKERDWEYSYINPNEGFMGVRWCPSWIRTDIQAAAWQPAGADIYRVQRKGNAGADARTLVLTCSPNSAQIPAGDPVVIWEASADDTVSTNTTHDFNGYNLQLKSKLNISACIPSLLYDINGRQIIEIDTGEVLPVIDYLPPFFTNNFGVHKSTMQLRHWQFYVNSANKQLRLPFPYFFQNTRKAVLSGANVILGGNQWAPTNYDWSKDYFNFGASLTEELFRKECEGLANYFNDLPPSHLAVELENKVFHHWENIGSTIGYKSLLNDVWYPIARTAWGQERTLIVKGPGNANGTLSYFDWSPPNGERAHLAVHANNTELVGPNGGISLASIAESDWLAVALRDKINDLGFSGGGVTELRIDYPNNTVDKAKKMGRVLTSFKNNNLYTWYYGHIGTNPDFTPNVADVFSVNGFRIEALFPEMRAHASRAGMIFD